MAAMTDHNSAFLWETEALRQSPQRTAEEAVDDAEAAPGQWMTLRAASRSTGIPVETLRKWARRGTIPTFLEPTNLGTNIRLVDLDGVQQRAAELGRSLNPEPASAMEAEQRPVVPAPTPPDTMIVPVDAWNKMLTQLGNLHEAGQQLAAARERAAKAETEAEFLRERLSEIRQDSSALGTPEPLAAAPEPTVEVAPPPEKVWHYLVRRVRDRKSG